MPCLNCLIAFGFYRGEEGVYAGLNVLHHDSSLYILCLSMDYKTNQKRLAYFTEEAMFGNSKEQLDSANAL